jgi:hypothetical protein
VPGSGHQAVDEGRENDHEQEVGNREHHVHDLHERRVHTPPEVAGDEPERHADAQHQDLAQESHGQRDPGPVEEPAQDVPAETVRPQNEARARRGVDGVGVLGGEGVGCQELRGGRHQRERDDARGREDRHVIPPEPSDLARPEEARHRGSYRYRIRGSTAA